MKPTPCRLACSAALCLALSAAFTLPAAAGAVRAEVTRALSQEQSALDSASDRLTALTESMRPRARSDEGEVVASSRGSATAQGGTTTRALDFRALDAMPPASGDEAWQCLAQAIYFEARGEPIDGQVAVAEVVLNRASDRRFPSTVCGVTRQGAGSGRGCQFSYACDGNPDVMKSAVARSRAEKLAALMLAGHPRTVTSGATYFHTRSVRPSWSGRMVRTASIGHHYFYRSGTEVASAD
jgi:spore germination cell wall hydrolase CwlJ-like protein